MKTILCILLVCVYSSSQATNYYFSSSQGNDSRSSAQAQSPSTPWRSIDKLNAIFSSLRPGDNVFFNRGDVFYGAIVAAASGTPNNPITLSSYGSGDDPVISGFTTLSNWVAKGGGIWESTAPSLGSELNMLTINGTEYAMGRYPNSDAPNKGWLNFESHLTNVTITDYQLSSATNWTGAEVVIRNSRAGIDKGLIIAHAGNTLTYNSALPGGDAHNGFGYFIQKDIRTLDQYGEWYYNPSTKKVAVYFGAAGPAGDVKASAVNSLVTVKYQTNVTFNDLTFTGSNLKSFDIYYANNIRVLNSSILFSGADAIIAADAQHLTIDNNIISNTHADGIDFQYACYNSFIRNNKIYNTGMFAGMGHPNYSLRAIILNSSDNSVAEYNEIQNTGYIPISFGGNDIVIKNNFINNFLMVTDDGGAIYTSNMYEGASDNTGRKIIGNIITNAVGAKEGTDDATNEGGQGIYMDYNAAGVDIADNTIANCSETGFLNDVCHEVNITNNTFYNNGTQIRMIQLGTTQVRNLVFQNNILFSRLGAQDVSIMSSTANDISSFGSFDNNYYVRPLAEDFVVKTKQGSDGDFKHKYLNDWKAAFNMDQNSKGSPVQIAPYTLNGLIGGNKSGVSQAASQNAAVHIEVGALEASKQYILRFTSHSSEEGVYNFRFLQDHSPYAGIVMNHKFKVPAGAKDHEYLVTFPLFSDSKVAMRIESSLSSPFTVDNLQLYEANVTVTNPDDYFRFEYNASQSPKTISLDAYYVDVKNNPYTNSLTLQPYTSVVLIKKSPVVANQTISFAPLSDKILGDAPFTVSATATSGLPVSFRIASGPATISGNTITVTGLGTVAVEASQAGNAFYNAANVVTQSFNVERLNVVAPTPIFTLACSATGTIRRDQWNGIPGTIIATIPLQNAPASSSQLTSFEAPTNAADNFGDLIRGYLCPPQSGNYTFYIAGDDDAELYISTDDNPNNKTKIASVLGWTLPRQYTKFASQKSAPVYLQTGKRYYIEAIHKDGVGDDNLSVAWVLPDGVTEAPISGSRLSPYVTTIVVPAVPTCSATGGIRRDQWNGVPGTSIASIPLYLQSSSQSQLTSFEAPTNAADNFGDLIRGYLCPPQSGNYTFYIAGDDDAELYISTDDNPNNKTKIASVLGWTLPRQYTKFASQKSAPVYLQTGKRYYIEAIHKDGVGDDNLSVAWVLPDGVTEAPIPGNRLSPFTGYGAPTVARSTVMSNQQTDASVLVGTEAKLTAFPNPFTTSATVQFYPEESADATLDLYDIQGRRIKSLFTGRVEAGTPKTFTLQSAGLTSGTYVLRLTTKTKVISKKVTLAK